jgi:hypothetical protein
MRTGSGARPAFYTKYTSSCEEILLRSVRRLLVAACVVLSSPILVTLMKDALGFSETSALTRGSRRNTPEDTFLLSHRRENLKSYIPMALSPGVKATGA